MSPVETLIDELATAIIEGRKRGLTPIERDILQRCTRPAEGQWYRIHRVGNDLGVSPGFVERDEAQEICDHNPHCLGVINSDWLQPRAQESFGYRSPEEEHAAADSGPVGFGSIDDLPCDCEWPDA